MSAADPFSGDTKTCPMCGEEIKATATKCRFCGEALTDGALDPVQVQEAAKKLLREQQDKSTALQIFITGLIGCFSPIVCIYGLVFLLRRPYQFPRKGLAIAGTVLHFIWTALLVAQIVFVVLMSDTQE